MSKPAGRRRRARRPPPASDWRRTHRRRATSRRPAASALRAVWQNPAAGRCSCAAAGICSTEPITPERRNSARSVGLSTITSATSPEKLMSLAPIDSSTDRAGGRAAGVAAVTAPRNSVSCALTLPEQLAPDLVAGIRAPAASRTARRRWSRRCRRAAGRSPRCADIARPAPARCGSGSCTASGDRPN